MHIPDFTVPAFAGKLARRLPKRPPSMALAAALNLARQRGVLPDDVELLADRTFVVEALDAGITTAFTFDGQRFSAIDPPATPDLYFAANAADFARLALREEDPDTLFFNRKLVIEGDTELGLIVKNLLDSIDWSDTPIARFVPV